MQKLIVLDYRTGEVNVYPFDQDLWEDVEEFNIDGYCPIHSDTHYMITNELSLKIHEI